MAQPIHCDGDGDQHPADVLVSQLADGQTMAWCFPHYLQAARMLVAIADEPTAEDRAAEDAALARLGVPEHSQPAVETDATEGTADDVEVGGVPIVDPVTVVPRGRSKSRAAHEARQRARKTEVAPEPADEADGAQRPSDGPTEGIAADAVEA